MRIFIVLLIWLVSIPAAAAVDTGADIFFASQTWMATLKGKKVALLTNHTGMLKDLTPTYRVLISRAKEYSVIALFAPEHGLDGASHAAENVADQTFGKIPVYSLHGKTRRPTEAMLKGIDVILVDVQDVGTRCYTYVSTVCYVMEEAAKAKIPVIIFDRPNPINGLTIDGCLVDAKCKSFIGYIDTPFVHGMTIGELARLHNGERAIGCDLTVVPMKGWKRSMSFKDTGLIWVPTSPNIPEPDTGLYYPITGFLGDLSWVSIGVGYTLPFKLVGAPWIKGEDFAAKCNKQKLPGVLFQATAFKPMAGSFEGKECEGVRLIVTNPRTFKPASTGFMLAGLLKSLYPANCTTQFSTDLTTLIGKITGTPKIAELLSKEKYPAWKMIDLAAKESRSFAEVRRRYLLPDYPI